MLKFISNFLKRNNFISETKKTKLKVPEVKKIDNGITIDCGGFVQHVGVPADSPLGKKYMKEFDEFDERVKRGEAKIYQVGADNMLIEIDIDGNLK